MDALNMPLEMIAVCSPDGELSPARFRLETESGERVTVRIRQIRRREEIRLMGVESIRFDCLALLGGQLRRARAPLDALAVSRPGCSRGPIDNLHM